MRISDWSSDVCSSDLFCSAPRNSVAGLRHSGPKTAALPVHKPSLYQPVPVCAGIHSMRDTTVNAAFLKRPGIWSRSHYLDRMNLRDLVAAYFQYYAIQAYLLLAVAAAGLAVWKPSGAVQNVAAVVAAVVLYPLVWYVLHRWVLPSR